MDARSFGKGRTARDQHQRGCAVASANGALGTRFGGLTYCGKDVVKWHP